MDAVRTWLRDSRTIKRVPHVAFEVDDIEKAIDGFKVIYSISSPSEGVRSAMIVHDGAPIELIEFSATRKVAKNGVTT